MSKLKVRDSGIELLKIFAMILIVSCHVIQTLSCQEINGKRIFDFTMTGQGMTITTASALLYNGALGNFIFFACSAWFLLDSQKSNKRKIWNMISDVWIISVIALVTAYFIMPGNISIFEVIKNLLPITYQMNWYITAYVLFYVIHPALNGLIDRMNQVWHFRVTFVVVLIYYIWSFFFSMFGDASFFGNIFVLWIVFYFIIAYMKRYMQEFNSNLKMNIILLIIGLIGHFGLIYGTEVFKLISGIFTDKLQYWNRSNNPFIMVIAISLLNISKQGKWKNKAVNYISSLTLFIYLIHENWFVRGCLRPYIWQQIHDTFGYDYLMLWIFVFTLVLFIASAFLAVIYKSTIHKIVMIVSNKIYNQIRLIYGKLEKQLIKLH